MLLQLHALLDRCVRVFELIAVLTSAALLLAIMSLVSLDALMRHFLNMPLHWQYTVTSGYLLVGLICMALPWGFRTGGYVRVSGLAMALPPVLRTILLRTGLLLSAAYVGALAWKSGQYFLKTFNSGEMQITTIQVPAWVSWVWVPAGLGLLTLRLFLAAVGPATELDVEHEPAEEI